MLNLIIELKNKDEFRTHYSMTIFIFPVVKDLHLLKEVDQKNNLYGSTDKEMLVAIAVGITSSHSEQRS